MSHDNTAGILDGQYHVMIKVGDCVCVCVRMCVCVWAGVR